MEQNPFLVPDTNYKSTTSIKETLNSDGAIPSVEEENPFIVKSQEETNPFLVPESKSNWGTTDARDYGKKNSGMSSKLTTAESGDLGKKRLFPSLIEEANKPIFGAMAVWDKAASALGGKETTAAQDWYGDTFMRQASRELEQTQRDVSQFADKDAEFAYKVPETIGRLAGQMLYMVPGMQAAPALQKSISVTAPTLVQRLGSEAAQGVLTGTPMAASASSETYHRLINAGVPKERAVIASTAVYVNTLLQVMAPVSVQGAMPTRMASAGAFNWAGEQTEEQLVNSIVSEWPDAQVKRTTVDNIITFGIGSVMGGVLGKGKEAPKNNISPSMAAEAEAFVKNEAGLGKIDPNAGIDASAAHGMYQKPDPAEGLPPEASLENPPDATALRPGLDLTKNNIRNSNLYNEFAAKNNLEQVPGMSGLDEKITNEKSLNQPYWVDEELQAAIKAANKQAQTRENFGQQYPSDDLARGEPTQAELVSDPLAQRTPEQARQDYTIDTQNPRNPYMTPEQLEEAQRWADQDKPGYGEMEIPPEAANIPYWADAALEKAKASANRVGGRRAAGPVDISRDGGGMKPAPVDSPVTGKHQTREAVDITDPKHADVVSKVESSILEAELTVNGKNGISLAKAIELALKFEKDPEIRAIAVRLQALADRTTPLFVESPDDVSAVGPDNSINALGRDSVGIHSTLEGSGNKAVAIRGTGFAEHGVKPEIIFHEGGHNVSDHAWIIASDPVLAAKPEYANHVQFVKDVNALMEAVRKQAGEIPKEFEPAFTKGGYEFNTYGWTNKNFRDWLANVKLPDGRSALQKFKDFFRGLLGYKVESNDGKAAVDKLLDSLESIQDYNKKDVGEVLARRGKNETKSAKTIEEAVELTKKDIGAERYIPMTVNQKALFLRNPVIKLVYDKFRQFENEEDVRFNLYKTYVHDFEQFVAKSNNRQPALKMLKVLADIQDPALKEARALAESTNTREQFLFDHGMREDQIPMAIKILNVMKAVGNTDQKLALEGMGHNWHLEPMYFPREHTGPFSVTVVDGSGKITYMRGFEHSKLAQEAATSLKNSLKDTGYEVSLSRNEPGSMGDLYNMLNLHAPEGTPDFLLQATDKMLKEIEVAKRKFEMERSSDNIAGYTGEVVYGTDNPFSSRYDQDTKLLTLFQRRLEGSFQLALTVKTLNEIKKPLLDDPTVLMEVPNTQRMVRELVARQLGQDISWFMTAGGRADKAVEGLGKAVNKVMATLQGREAWDVSYFKPQEIARFSQAYVWTMSIFKLGLSPSTLMANTSTMLTTPIDGVRTAGREGISQVVPAMATLKMMTSHLDPEAIAFMKDAKLEGMIEARLSDPLTITNSHARGAIDRAVNAPRDAIEKATNYSTLLYYYNFYRLAYPDMKPTSREFKTKVYEATRSWTGDYTHAAQLIAISRGGAAGHLQSNFAKWKFNQIGRLADDFRSLGEGKVMPLATTLLLTTLMAGAVGAPIAVEYEALRRLGMKTGWWDLKPLSAFLWELEDKKLMPEWAIKGPMSYVADDVAKELGLTAPDLSGNVRYSSVLDVSTLPFGFAQDVGKLLTGSAKAIYKAADNAAGGTYPGNTTQETKEMMKGLPVVMENVLTEQLNKRYGGESGVGQYSSKDAGQYKRNEQEQALAYLGLRSKDENDYRDKDYSRGWFDRKAKKDFTENKDLIIANLDRPENIQPLAKKIYELRGMEGIKEVIRSAEETLKNRRTDSFSRDLAGQLNNRNAVAQARSLELLRKFRPSK